MANYYNMYNGNQPFNDTIHLNGPAPLDDREVFSSVDGVYFTHGDKNHPLFNRAYKGMQVVIFDGSLIMIFLLILFKIYTTLLFELFAIILFSISLYHFTDILAGLTKSTEYFVCLIPVLIILSLIFTPVFLNLSIFKPIQMLFPSYYYLTSVYYPKNFIPFVVYTIILCSINCFQKSHPLA